MVRQEMNDKYVDDDFRVADIYPLHKGGDYYDPKNFRPVSCGNCLFKLLESIFMNAINIDK